MTSEELDKVELTDEQEARLVEYRGGCSCHLSPPCAAHSDPLTLDEAEWLGLLDDEVEPAVDLLAITRSFCK